jgi:hypothetical protein
MAFLLSFGLRSVRNLRIFLLRHLSSEKVPGDGKEGEKRRRGERETRREGERETRRCRFNSASHLF